MMTAITNTSFFLSQLVLESFFSPLLSAKHCDHLGRHHFRKHIHQSFTFALASALEVYRSHSKSFTLFIYLLTYLFASQNKNYFRKRSQDALCFPPHIIGCCIFPFLHSATLEISRLVWQTLRVMAKVFRSCVNRGVCVYVNYVNYSDTGTNF